MLVHAYSFLHKTQRIGQNSITSRFGGKRQTDDHQPVPYDDHFVQLLDLFQENWNALEVQRLAGIRHCLVEYHVVGFRENYSGE